jgi:hypothetical protein
MTPIGKLQLGPLSLHAPTSWTFFPFGKMVTGQTISKIGNLQITLAYATDTKSPADHAACLDVLREFINEPQSEVVYAERLDHPDAMFGHVTIHDDKVFRRYWYRHKKERLLLALYQCAAKDFSAANAEIDEANAIAASMELLKPISRG